MEFFEPLEGLRQVSYLSVILRLVCSVIIGGVIGLERGMKNRPAGLRTYMLVCVGSCLVMMTNQFIYQSTGSGDPMRLGAQVISGIGFLGAGTIVVTQHNQIKGLTTAAGLWACAAAGLALGIGFYEAAIAGGFAIFAVMTLMQKMDKKVHRKTKTLEVYIEVDQTLTLGQLMHLLHDRDLDVEDVQRESGLETDEEGHRAYTATLKSPKRVHHIEIVEEVRSIEGVVYVEEL